MKLSKFINDLNQQVSISSLVFFRLSFGAILLWEVFRYFDNGWIARYWMRPDFYFSYSGFGWLQPLPGDGMLLLFYGLGVCAVAILLGLFYRWATILFFIGFTYVFLLDKTNYLNHFYLISLISFLLIFLPANRALSLDVYFKRVQKNTQVPAWAPAILAFQLGVAYFFGGIAKLNADWLRGYPLFDWLGGRMDYPLIGQFFDEKWMVLLFSYSGLLLDLLIVPALIYRRTRIPAYIAIVTFHLMNHGLWQIGIFPWFMIAATTLFFDPAWFKRILDRAGARLFDGDELSPPTGFQHSGFKLGLLSVFILIQLFMPLRHWLYGGNVSWNELGHRFSWHMKLRDKEAQAKFRVFDPKSNEFWDIDNRDFLSRRQAQKMSTRPDMILQFAHHLGEIFIEDGYPHVRVFADVEAGLNGREYQQLIDSRVDLLGVDHNTHHDEWIVPLSTKLP